MGGGPLTVGHRGRAERQRLDRDQRRGRLLFGAHREQRGDAGEDLLAQFAGPVVRRSSTRRTDLAEDVVEGREEAVLLALKCS